MDEYDDGRHSGAAESGEKNGVLDVEIDEISLTPKEHEKVKNLVNGEEMRRIQRHTRRYLIVGEGGETEAANRRMIVYHLLDERDDAISTRLEDFDLTSDEIRLWTRIFDILCGRATHVVGVLEDYKGGYVWELGLSYSTSYRDKLWVLKRRYENEKTEREHFDNGMAASHIGTLMTSKRGLEWTNEDELRDRVSKIP